MGKGYQVEVKPAATKRLFGLKTVLLATQYGAIGGIGAGGGVSWLLAREFYRDDIAVGDKAGRMGKLCLYSGTGLAAFLVSIRVLAMIKIKG